MRYAVFLVCFFVSCFVLFLFSDEAKQPLYSTPIDLPNEIKTIPLSTHTPERKWTDLEYQSAQSVQYSGYEITNSAKGLDLKLKSRRALFIKNNNDFGLLGVFGLRDLLNNGRKQLVYLSTTGGNHCCAEFVIVDLNPAGPRVIFRSADYEVQMAEADSDKDALLMFDDDSDGRMEITQEINYGLGMDCPQVSNPTIYVGFAYDSKKLSYLPMRRFAPEVEGRNNELKMLVKNDNAAIERGEQTDSLGCQYETAISTIALSHILIGREREGYDYLLKNYRALDYRATPFRFDRAYSDRQGRKTVADMKRVLSTYKLHNALYKH
jgi:hypothetical protein